MDQFRFLSPTELNYLTGHKTKKAQSLELARMDIPFLINRKGEPIVLMSDLTNDTPEKKVSEAAPKWHKIKHSRPM